MKDLNKKDWKTAMFTDVVKDITGGNRKFQSNEYKPSGSFPIIDQGDKFVAGYTDEDNIVNRKKSVVIFGDHTKKLKFVDFDFCLGADGVKILEPSEKLESRYLFFYLSNVKLPEVGYSRHYKFLKEIQIPLPPLSTQKYIAQILDKADALRKKDQQLLQYYDDLAQSLFINLFGDPVKNEKGWKVKKLGEICDRITDGEHATPKRSLNGIKLLSARNIKNGYIDFDAGMDYIQDDEYLRISKRCNPIKGNVLMSCSGSVGRVATIEFDERISLVRSVALIIPTAKYLDSRYLEYYLRSDLGQREIDSRSKKSSQANIFTGAIKEIKTLIPPIELQNQFTQQIQNIEKQKEKVKAQMQASEETFQSLLQQVFA